MLGRRSWIFEKHYEDIAIRRPRYDETTFLPTWRLLNQTIRPQSKTEKVSSEMAGAVMKAILNGTPYPVTLINAVECRINVEHNVSPDKAAIIKAYYLRKTTNKQFKEALQMDINEESEYLPYVLGRLFSIYEQIQLAAIPGINTTIKDKYFTSASATPARIFPILGDLAAKHMRKTWQSEGLKIKLDKALGALTGKVGDHYPSRLSLEERGAFQLGYYFENGNGLVTDVCIKRKIRDYVQMAMDEQAPWRIYIQNRRTLNRLDSEALEAEHIDARPEDKDFAKEIKALKKDDPTLDLRLRDYMCSQFFDIRTFGAVMTTFVKGSLSCGQVRGPVQFGFARSIDPVNVQEVSITRIAVTTEADAADKNNTMGNKFIIPYGLYRMNGYISAKLAQNVTGFCDEDLDMLWQAILNMFELDRSAARGNMAVRKLYVFKHNSALGDAPSWKLFDSIDVHKRDGVDVARSFSDYEVQVNHEAIPDSVSVSEMVDRAL